jgi:heme oxygenase
MRELLKRSTRSLHVDVEQSLDIPHRTRNLAAYRKLLERFYGFHRPLEDALARVSGYEHIGLQFAARRKLPLLRDDLLALGASPAALDTLPVCDDLPAFDDLPAAMGCLYVLEGSTLGGQMITRLVARNLGLEAGTGASYFASYGDRVATMWSGFCESLERLASSSTEQRESMVQAAQATFVNLERWLGSKQR